MIEVIVAKEILTEIQVPPPGVKDVAVLIAVVRVPAAVNVDTQTGGTSTHTTGTPGTGMSVMAAKEGWTGTGTAAAGRRGIIDCRELPAGQSHSNLTLQDLKLPPPWIPRAAGIMEQCETCQEDLGGGWAESGDWQWIHSADRIQTNRNGRNIQRFTN